MTYIYPQSDECRDRCAELGAVVEVMLQAYQYRYFPLACLAAWVTPPVLLGQYKIYYNERGGPAGYLTWAFFSKEVEREWIGDPTFIPHLSEWNEGGSLWITDFAAPSGFSRVMRESARDDLFRDFRAARWLRRNNDGTVRKVVKWKR